jgi:hypothetical protein
MLKALALSKNLCKQSSWMMEGACSSESRHGKTAQEKHDAMEVMLTFCAPLPDKGPGMPSLHDPARILGVPYRVLKALVL